MFSPVRREMRAKRKVPDMAALIAIANDQEALQRTLSALTTDQLLWVFQQAMLRCGAETRFELHNTALGELLSRDIERLPEFLARWLTAPAPTPPDPQWANDYAAEAVILWGRTNAPAAADFLAQLPLAADAHDRFSLYNALAEVCGHWAGSDYPGALAWAEALPNGDVRKVFALEGIFSPPNEFHPEDQKRCVEQLLGSSEEMSNLAREVAANLARHETTAAAEPQAAVTWAMSLPDAPTRREALKSIVGAWAPVSKTSLGQTLEWAASFPPDDARAAIWETVAIAWQWTDCESNGFVHGDPEFFPQLKASGKLANDWLRGLPPGADRDAALATREKWEDSILHRMTWR